MKKLGIVLAVCVPLLICLGVLTRSETPILLVFGWVAFLWRVLPQITVDWPSVAVGMIAVFLFAAGVHWAGRSWQRRHPVEPGQPTRRWKVRWTLAVVAVVFLLFAAGIAMIGFVHQTVWLLASDQPLVGESLKHHRDSPANNLRSIGIAMHNYYDAERTFPPGGSFTPDGTGLHSWETHLLIYIGYSTEGIDLQRPWNDPANQPKFKTVPSVFINPGFRTPELTDAEGYGLSHYAANSRVLGCNTTTRIQDITDGTAHTLLVGEVNTNFRPWGHPVNWRDPARGINRSPQGFGGPAGSGGAHFVMADASVRFISDRTSPEVLRALSTPAARDEVDETVLGSPRPW